ncbi:MAG: acetyl-CoA C-acetyltransferase [Acidimicrobiia bacterium]|jgi:acetyl-CoA C-acetyltransferase|nr:acetyl-CoA C-acetyltransferase [Microthrixaceae bacterium]MCB9402571.1 acetyl-CoA C-acetyltransferase [Microthrixaceae bacterium]MCO5306906.1 acetyl-CoA C-acetyltransferase [Microthrixaceae bacterium]RTL07570.1 MAG: acetyl-CoA C-acetyltransferase [Acidimicrobiia bacterium]
MTEAVIVATARTPIGRMSKGSLKDMRPDDLSAHIITSVLDKVPALDRTEIEDVLWGCGQPGGESGHNIARVAAVLAGLDDVPGATVNRYCSSSLMTIRMAAHAIKAGDGDVFVAGGVETASRFPFGMADGPKNPVFTDAEAHSVERAQGGAPVWAAQAGLPDMYLAMGQTAENVAQLENVSRQDQDEFAVRSQNLAEESLNNGYWEAEITPVTTPDGVVGTDDGIRPGTTYEKVSGLSPVFRPDGTVTAGNACPLNDGAAAVVVMSDTKAKALGLTPLARIISSAATGLNPEIMGLGPVEAVRKALGRAGMSVDDIDLFEINEAFAAQVLPSARQLGIPMEKLNTRGGSIALGHPFGMTGARIMTTLIHNLQESDKTFGVETMCVGGGQGMAMVVERLS